MSVDFYIAKLNFLNKSLTDKKSDAERKRKGDEVLILKDRINTKLHELRQKQDERDEKEEKLGRGAQVVSLCADIRDLVKDLDKDIKEMRSKLGKAAAAVKTTDKMGQEEMKRKQILLKNLQEQIDDAKDREQMGKVGGSSGGAGVATLTELRSGELYGANKQRAQLPDRKLDTSEAEALQRWKEKEVMMDKELAEINDGLGLLENRARDIGEVADHHNERLGRLNEDAEKANTKLKEVNRRVNKVLADMRGSGSKICTYVIFICVMLGVLGLMNNLFRDN
mmetsp:Transcript_35991/g.40958  ORF Transcript_35991/g.40958 Transcript_35991/m.40958 type:complete len:281 (+) Transcript_35991:66-908(+)|eukprot:CAMPEP_0115005600 /NCGR_PEP_ID=MMETSP0216-20121206/19978_1 /TAXON_ID=223996 /ORGANISM="Protocruzia adherens, Strain Boccale" /LENGTH=280 /DNA_ID=CAMNT_0002371977 /DNA_START=89 /DNA_END=931 /DNA_ORIENTATION=-